MPQGGASEDAAHRRTAPGVAVAPAHAEALQRLGGGRRPIRWACTRAFRRGAVHRGQRMAPALAAAGVVDAVEERGRRTNGAPAGAGHAPHAAVVRRCATAVDEHPLRARVFAVAVALAGPRPVRTAGAVEPAPVSTSSSAWPKRTGQSRTRRRCTATALARGCAQRRAGANRELLVSRCSRSAPRRPSQSSGRAPRTSAPVAVEHHQRQPLATSGDERHSAPLIPGNAPVMRLHQENEPPRDNVDPSSRLRCLTPFIPEQSSSQLLVHRSALSSDSSPVSPTRRAFAGPLRAFQRCRLAGARAPLAHARYAGAHIVIPSIGEARPVCGCLRLGICGIGRHRRRTRGHRGPFRGAVQDCRRTNGPHEPAPARSRTGERFRSLYRDQR